MNESNYLSLGLLENYLSRDCERCSTGKILVIASTHIPQKVDQLRINQYSIDWSEAIDKEDLSKPLRFFLSKSLLFLSKSLLFLSKSLPFFFVSIGNIPIHRSEIDLSMTRMKLG